MIRDRLVSVTAPSRLHFGLIAFGEGHELEYGGVGLMLSTPFTRIRFSSSDNLQLETRNQRRARQVIRRWLAIRAGRLPKELSAAELPVRIRQTSGPRPHIGLGSGTQLALALATGLDHWFGLHATESPITPSGLGRGRRSAVGSHGFYHGGLIVDGGKAPGRTLGALAMRIALPESWRIVLACPKSGKGPSGIREDQLFRTLPSVSQQTAQALRSLIDEQLVPAARHQDFDAFSRAVRDYGYLAGSCYGRAQCGSFHSPAVRELIEAVQSAGVAGTGQSSWGPCVFAVCRSPDHANALLEQLQRDFSAERCWFRTAAIADRGHAVSERMAMPVTMESRTEESVVSGHRPDDANAPTDPA